MYEPETITHIDGDDDNNNNNNKCVYLGTIIK